MSKRRQDWEDICSSLACENLYEDGELSMAQAKRKRRDLISRAKKLYDTGYPCPRNIFEWCEDEEAIENFLEETNDVIFKGKIMGSRS
tara:strand:- start:730 stop:993 length:264 start_codon:yes stop_codon:yes gene_type:complete